ARLACRSSETMSTARTPPSWDGKLDLASLKAAYRSGISPVDVINSLYDKISAYERNNPHSWVYLAPLQSVLDAAQVLEKRFPNRDGRPKLFGVPFTLKDSMDI